MGVQSFAAAAYPVWCQYVPDAFQSAACGGRVPASTPSAGNRAGETKQLKQEQGDVQSFAAVSYPSWCQFVPDAFQSTACGGRKPASTPSAGNRAGETKQLEQEQRDVQSFAAASYPVWCQYVPDAFQS